MIDKQFEDNGFVITENTNGSCVKVLKPTLSTAEESKSLEEQIKSLKQDNLILMDAIATMFEEILTLKGEPV
jgi:hypothetical protein